MPHTALVWLRRDLRLADSPALSHAASAYDRVIPLFVWTPDEAGDGPPGGTARSRRRCGRTGTTCWISKATSSTTRTPSARARALEAFAAIK